MDIKAVAARVYSLIFQRGRDMVGCVLISLFALKSEVFGSTLVALSACYRTCFSYQKRKIDFAL